MDSKIATGWDLGGAHIKVARWMRPSRLHPGHHGVPCTLWRGLEHLERALAATRSLLPPSRGDDDRRAGRPFRRPQRRGGRLIDSMLAIFPAGIALLWGRGGLPRARRGQGAAAKVASGQLLTGALAQRGETGLLVDIGSTTTDILPIAGGAVHCGGFSDETRMILGGSYTGVTRTGHGARWRCSFCRAAPAAHGGIFRHRGGCPSPDRRAA